MSWSSRLTAASGTRARDGMCVTPVMAGQLALAVYAACVPGPMIHTRQITRQHRTLDADSVVQCAGVVTRRFAKRGRPYVEIDFDIAVAGEPVWDGSILCTNPNTSCDDLPDEAGSGLPAHETGRVLARLTHSFDLEAMTAFSGPGNIHSDVAAAQAVGLDRPVVQGMQLAALCDRLLADHWGADWLVRGEWEVRFVGMAWEAEILESTLLESGTGVALSVTKADGTVCLAGTAGLAAT